MNRQNETKLLVFSLLFTTALLGFGFSLWNQFTPGIPDKEANVSPDSDSTTGRISLGEQILITDQLNSDEERGVQAFDR
ncbi:MAG: ABC transporter substrate-binding protein, partial [Dolichospermum sp.]